MKVIVLEHRDGRIVFNADNPNVWLNMFNELDDMGYYDLSEGPLYDKARAGNVEAAKRVVQARQRFEYENYQEYDVID